MERVLTALVVEPNAAMRNILLNLLEQLGADAAQAGQPEAALERLRTGPPLDLVAVDCMGPDQGGMAWLAEARRVAPPSTRILVVSGETRKARIAAALEAGAGEYLMTPFPREAFREKLVLLGLAE